MKHHRESEHVERIDACIAEAVADANDELCKRYGEDWEDRLKGIELRLATAVWNRTFHLAMDKLCSIGGFRGVVPSRFSREPDLCLFDAYEEEEEDLAA